MKEIKILAIETSCDETAAAVVGNGRHIYSNIINSQIDIHKLYGGVVPEIASRRHLENIDPVIRLALQEAGFTLADMDAVAVTYGPGLVGALLVGVATGKALAYAAGKPLIAVNHIEGHISANFPENKDLEPPFAALVVSGGHTYLANVPDYGTYEIIGKTRDDAAGEAFDKIARALDLGYPGGPKIDALAKTGDPKAIDFPRANVADAPMDFSFSGLKSAVLNYMNSMSMKKNAATRNIDPDKKNSPTGESPDVRTDHTTSDKVHDTVIKKEDVAASFQAAVTDAICDRAMLMCEERGIKKLAIAGGVAANSALRAQLETECKKRGIAFYRPSIIMCTDNAAMIGAAAYYKYLKGDFASHDLNAVPGLGLK